MNPFKLADTLLDVFRLVADALLASGVAEETLRFELDAAAIRRANLAADAAEAAKFGGE